jgi:peptidoglycan/xylan/chitin deacetylase (PgdA/CDA1 family)
LGKLFLLRYDTESNLGDEVCMGGFLEKAVSVHRGHGIPATFFCTGRTLEEREKQFIDFSKETKDDPLFDVQDHSYSHIGLGYRNGKPVDVLRADYDKSLATHERVLGRRPVGISICGTGGTDGPRLTGFDETEKARAEFEMLAGLGIKMINSFLVGVDESKEFISYRSLRHPEIMGFPSGFSDTRWMLRREYGDPMEFVLGKIRERAGRGEHMPLMLHNWVAWLHSPDQELTHVVKIADFARECGYELVTHIACYHNGSLYQSR